MYPVYTVLLLECLTQFASAGVLRNPLLHRDESRVKARASCPTPSALSSGTLNVTLPDPDPSVNASLQYLPTGNASVYIVENSTSLQNITLDDSNSGTATQRRSLYERVWDLFKRADSVAASSGGHDDDGGAGGSSGPYSYSGSSGRTSSEGSESSGSGFSEPSETDSDAVAAKAPTPPDAAAPAAGFPAKVTLAGQREEPVRLPPLVVQAGGLNAHAYDYYNDEPASNWTRDNATYESPPSYYTEFGFTNYDSVIFWFDYKYQNFYSWFYPAYMHMSKNTQNPGIGGVTGNISSPSVISDTVGFEDPRKSCCACQMVELTC